MSKKHTALIEQLRAAENLIMSHGNTVVSVDGKSESQLLDEGDIRPLINGYKILNVKFEEAFGRSWTPSQQFRDWAALNQPKLLKEE